MKNNSKKLSELKVFVGAYQSLKQSLCDRFPSVFSRFYFLANHRNIADNQYNLIEMESHYGSDISNLACMSLHDDLYRQVLALTLDELEEQIFDFLQQFPGNGRTLLSNWMLLPCLVSMLAPAIAGLPFRTEEFQNFIVKMNMAISSIAESRYHLSL